MDSRADQLLSSAGAHLGDRVLVEDDGRRFEGVVMPRHAFSQPDTLILKLDSGYNVGVRCTKAAKLHVLTKAQPKPAVARSIPKQASKPTVALLGTGGTIASYVDYRTGAVHPAATAEELAFATPELFDIVNVDVEVVYQVFSEDLEPKNWTELARRVEAAFKRGAKGVIIPHGTDTLHYTAAALSFALSNLPGPVVLVGAQRSSDRPSSDAASNLIAAARVASRADLGEVVIVMHEGPSDTAFSIHRGTRARKNHTSRRDAFESVNAPPLGRVEGDQVHVEAGARRRSAGPVERHDAFESNCRLVWSNPLLRPEDLSQPGVRGVLLAGTGLGHIPRRCLEAVAELHRSGALVVMTSQCIWGRVNLSVYSTGRDLLVGGVVPADDMLPEVAFVKLMWSLGQAANRDEAAKRFRTIVAGECDAVTRFEGA